MNQAGAVQVGVLVPAGNIVHEREFARLCPPGVRFHFAEFAYPAAGSRDFCADLAALMTAPLQRLVAQGARAVLIGCTTASMACAAPAFVDRLSRHAQVPVISAAGAVLAALRVLGIGSVAVATPYGEANNQIVREFLQGNGVTVTALHGLGFDRTPEMWREKALTLSAEDMLQFSLDTHAPNADAIYLPCTGVPSVDIIDRLESATGKPVLSSVQAGFWAILRRVGFDGRRESGGRMLKVWDFNSAS
jgi:arylmalonate decarboxylase